MRRIYNYNEYNDFVNEGKFKNLVAAGTMALGTTLGSATIPSTTDSNKTELSTTDTMYIPNKLQMKEVIFAFGMDMEITSDGKKIGKVVERTFNWGRTFELYNSSGKKIATAKEEVLTLKTIINIKDVNGKKIGSLECEFMESLLSLYSIYSIKDANGKVIGKSKKLSILKTDIDIRTNSGSVELSKKFFSITDTWDINITDTTIDKRILVFIPAFVSASQAEHKKNN